MTEIINRDQMAALVDRLNKAIKVQESIELQTLKLNKEISSKRIALYAFLGSCLGQIIIGLFFHFVKF